MMFSSFDLPTMEWKHVRSMLKKVFKHIRSMDRMEREKKVPTIAGEYVSLSLLRTYGPVELVEGQSWA
jgi:hypothetical protein